MAHYNWGGIRWQKNSDLEAGFIFLSQLWPVEMQSQFHLPLILFCISSVSFPGFILLFNALTIFTCLFFLWTVKSACLVLKVLFQFFLHYFYNSFTTSYHLALKSLNEVWSLFSKWEHSGLALPKITREVSYGQNLPLPQAPASSSTCCSVSMCVHNETVRLNILVLGLMKNG